MPDRPAASSQAQPRGLGGTLKSKMGPLPLWGWLAIMTVIAVAYYLYAQHKNAQQPAQPAAGAPGVTVINQGDLPPTSPPPEPPKPKPKDKDSGDDKKDDSEEAQDDKSGSGDKSDSDKRGGQGHRHHSARHH